MDDDAATVGCARHLGQSRRTVGCRRTGPLVKPVQTGAGPPRIDSHGRVLSSATESAKRVVGAELERDSAAVAQPSARTPDWVRQASIRCGWLLGAIAA